MIYAETVEAPIHETGEELEPLEFPSIKNYLEEGETSEPRFFFTQSRMQGTIEEPIKVTFFSDREVSEARVKLPEAAQVLNEQLPAGISMEQDQHSKEWMIQAQRAQNTFVLPLVFEVAGTYEVVVAEDTVKIEVYDHDKTQMDEDDSVEEKSDQDYVTERNWNINSFPLIISRGDQLIRPELIPNTYYFVRASNSSLPAGFGWMRASDRQPLNAGGLTNIKHIFPDIVQDTAGSNLDLFFDVSQSARMERRPSPGRLWSTTATNSPSVTADIALESSNGLAVEEPIYFYHGNSGYTLHIKKDDLIGVILPSTINTFTVVESEDTYAIDAAGTGGNNTGWIIRNGAQFRATTGTRSQGLSMFSDRPLTSAVKNLAFESFPIEGGSAESNKTSVFQGETVDISAFPNPGYQFSRWEIASGSDGVIEDVLLENTNFTMGSSDTVLRAIYETKVVSPVDPLDPEVEVDPENKPDLPEDQGLLSIDFVSSFNFGTQSISLQEQTYYAQHQRLLNEDGTVNEEEDRPNYVQISDRRPESERNGWTLAVTQKEQFKGEENQVLNGASLSLSNQQVITAQGGTAPALQSVPCTLVPSNRRTLLKAQGNEGTGTWIYRFGDGDSAGESVAINVPKGTNPEATTYSTTLIWELSAVPDN